MKTSEIIALLEQRHPLPEWVFISELRFGTGYDHWHKRKVRWERRIDGWAINCWPSKKLLRISYEIKVSRSDFLMELRQPEKRKPAMEVSNQFYFVTPDGLIAANELPEHCGLMVARDGKLKIQHRAILRDCPDPPWRFVASALRNARGPSNRARR